MSRMSYGIAGAVIAAVLVVAISADNVARWVLDVAPVVLVALVDSAEKVVMDSGLQIAAHARRDQRQQCDALLLRSTQSELLQS